MKLGDALPYPIDPVPTPHLASHDAMGRPHFMVNSNGKQTVGTNGMVRDVSDGKVRYDLVFDGPMIGRLAEHLTKGARHYGARNWTLAAGAPELERFKESLARHFCQYMAGAEGEDHLSAIIFNVMGIMLVTERIENDESRTCG